ncbi:MULTISPECIES: L(+)-tartrate dehydratase subunit beta [Campylobacter]|jgi:hydrolyase, tartrate beta subunit/fumarate domain protein, Fe-S type|uniref:L(+)-tartrate dehydratase subunit beta n=1 Tax=Campylobacter TaxID=194 RepID=UPI00027A360C|nr:MULTISPECIES: L(+)-tartrate dehydratase subunit beta [Campylobacter]EJP76425.1 L(+)-tartrate dehydratase subunit beta [Campylobacter sp. FOBRC14]
MSKKILTTPISAEDLKDIKIGDIIYLSGNIVTCRDVAHRRVIEEGRELPLDIRGGAIFHAGPIVRKIASGMDERYEIVSVGPTTSMRMEKFEKEFIAKTGVRIIVGKGGMGEGTMQGCKEFGALHCVFPAGCAVIAATQVEAIESVDWKDLGMPESLWNCRVREFGPLIVSIDVHGGNLFELNKIEFNRKKDIAIAEIIKQVGFIK